MTNRRKLITLVALALGIALLTTLAYLLLRPKPVPVEAVGQLETASAPAETEDTGNPIVLPVGKLLITELRAAYEPDTLRLLIPKLELDCTVGGDTLHGTMAQGPGLYKYAQMPNTYNTNVSIAAHRDLYGCEFLRLDELGEGDEILLQYQGMEFRYMWQSTAIVEPTNWDPIRTAADCRVTLTTCDPIGTDLNRMIVVGELAECRELTPGEQPSLQESEPEKE